MFRMRTFWSAAAAAFCVLGCAGCQHTRADYAQNAAERWVRMLAIEPTAKGKYEMMCGAYRKGVPFETFADTLAHNAYLNGATSLQVLWS